MKSVFDPGFRYTPADQTDIRKTFRRIRGGSMNADEAQQLMDEQEQLALDCLRVIYMDGHEGTANTLAALMGLSRQFGQQKESFTRRAA
jgi:hypothetical protein